MSEKPTRSRRSVRRKAGEVVGALISVNLQKFRVSGRDYKRARAGASNLGGDFEAGFKGEGDKRLTLNRSGINKP